MNSSQPEVHVGNGHREEPFLPLSTTSEANGLPGTVRASPGVAGKVLALLKWLVRRLLHHLRNPPIRIVLWNGEEVATSPARPVARVRIRERGLLLKLLANLDLAFGDAFTAGAIEVEGDLVEFLETVYRSRPVAATLTLLRRFEARWLNRPRPNSLSGSRVNIHHHYNLGNDFYRLWLDDQMVYTCAYFPTPSTTLEEAQVAKMEHVSRKLQLRPGQRVIEAGCGWGALALHMARYHGVTVRAFNVSHEQIVYARERARAEGLDRQVEFAEADYRAIQGPCDAFVSVGMLEHVGPAHYHDLGEVIVRCLKPTGRGLIHSIGRNKARPTNTWLEKRIFPGAYLPTLREMMEIFEPWGFSVLDVENLRLHYAQTLWHWLQRFDQVSSRVEKMFDPGFVRAWRLYLASSLAGFTTGFIQLFQVVFAPARNNDIPWTRAPLYASDPRAPAVRERP
jgi:cyclopropane-fatty-acyl-phospholipid synthase